MTDNPKCLYCSQPAVRIEYYSKTYPNGKDTIESPILCCDGCSDKAFKDLSICRGGIEGVHKLTFKEIGRMKEKSIGHLCAGRGYEINHLANKIWRTLIFQIHYRNQPTKKEILKESLSWYLSFKTDESLKSCAAKIMEDLK